MLTIAHSPRGSGARAARALGTQEVSRSATAEGDVVYATKAMAPVQSGAIPNTGEPAWFEAPPTSEQLCIAVDRGDLTKVRSLIAAGMSVETTTAGGQKTVLMIAAERGLMKVADELLMAGANPNTTSKHFGFTALMAAAVAGKAEMTSLLVEAGADVDCRTFATNAVSAIDLAQKHGHVEVVRALLMAGAELPGEHTAASVLEVAETNGRRQRGEDESDSGHPGMCGICFTTRSPQAQPP